MRFGGGKKCYNLHFSFPCLRRKRERLWVWFFEDVYSSCSLSRLICLLLSSGSSFAKAEEGGKEEGKLSIVSAFTCPSPTPPPSPAAVNNSPVDSLVGIKGRGRGRGGERFRERMRQRKRKRMIKRRQIVGEKKYLGWKNQIKRKRVKEDSKISSRK